MYDPPERLPQPDRLSRDQDQEQPVDPPSNILAIVGFALSFCIPPVGFLTSLIAVFREPRGFAIGGMVIGAVGSVILGCFAFVGYGMSQSGLFKFFDVIRDYEAFEQRASSLRASQNEWPTDISALNLPSESMMDPWGQPYEYAVRPDGSGWTLSSIGPDGAPDTADDIVLTNGMQPEEVSRALQPVMNNAIQDWLNRGGARAPSQTPATPAQPAATPEESAPATSTESEKSPAE